MHQSPSPIPLYEQVYLEINRLQQPIIPGVRVLATDQEMSIAALGFGEGSL